MVANLRKVLSVLLVILLAVSFISVWDHITDEEHASHDHHHGEHHHHDHSDHAPDSSEEHTEHSFSDHSFFDDAVVKKSIQPANQMFCFEETRVSLETLEGRTERYVPVNARPLGAMRTTPLASRAPPQNSF